MQKVSPKQRWVRRKSENDANGLVLNISISNTTLLSVI
jgi:hypothetical protein